MSASSGFPIDLVRLIVQLFVPWQRWRCWGVGECIELRDELFQRDLLKSRTNSLVWWETSHGIPHTHSHIDIHTHAYPHTLDNTAKLCLHFSTISGCYYSNNRFIQIYPSAYTSIGLSRSHYYLLSINHHHPSPPIRPDATPFSTWLSTPRISQRRSTSTSLVDQL
jgi:hypothetical protein